MHFDQFYHKLSGTTIVEKMKNMLCTEIKVAKGNKELPLRCTARLICVLRQKTPIIFSLIHLKNEEPRQH